MARGELLIFPSPENHVLPYLDGQTKGATACADKFLFKFEQESGIWDLHIMEFKKTIDISAVGKSQRQFTMGIYNARAIAGFLGMQIGNIYLYSGFRNNRLTGEQSMIALRAGNSRGPHKMIRQWENDRYELCIDGETKVFRHQKIHLDASGGGIISI